MHIEVDQSGKIGDTKVNTVLGFSNGISYAVVIPAQVKRNCVHYLRRYNVSGDNFYMRMFATGLYFLLKNKIKRYTRITIDIEYKGQETYIKEHLINLIRRSRQKIDPSLIQFKSIGKKSRAHGISLETFQRKRNTDLILYGDNILSGITIKKDRGPK